MKLKLKTGPADTTGVPILDTFVVETPFLTKREQEAVREKSIPAAQRGNLFAEEDRDLAAQAQSDAYVLRWTGLTNDILRAIGIPLAEDIPTNGDGCIPYDAELARDIWREAYDRMYSDKIRSHSHQIQLVAYERKKKPSSSAGA